MKENLYKTTDLWLTAFLVTHGARLIRLKQDNIKPDKVIFCLEDEQGSLKETAKSYYLGATVPAINYKDITLDLKHQIYRYARAKNEGDKIHGYNQTF
jgi:hypothetical protein